MTDFDPRAYERAMQRYLDNPLPRELRQQIAAGIEPITINRGFDHGEAMDLIGIAYPLIRDYLATSSGN